jgi:hypothetical protein
VPRAKRSVVRIEMEPVPAAIQVDSEMGGPAHCGGRQRPPARLRGHPPGLLGQSAQIFGRARVEQMFASANHTAQFRQSS